METKKGLQRLAQSRGRVNAIFDLPQVSQADIDCLNNRERDVLADLFSEKANSLAGVERESFLKKFEPIFTEDTKNQIWESNHAAIASAMSELLMDLNRIPTQEELAVKCGLSRQTVQKHLKEFQCEPLYLDQVNAMKMTTGSILSKLYEMSMQGSVKAARLYLEMIENLKPVSAANNTIINQQTNCIQINGIPVSQNTLNALAPKQRDQIENILRTALANSALQSYGAATT